MQILIIILVIYLVIWNQKKGSKKDPTSARKKQASARPNVPSKPASVKKQVTAVPNKTRKQERTKEEAAMEARTRASGQACHYEAAYSKGRPDRIGRRGDYEPATPKGMERIRCAYCGAENFVPAGTHDHYHCYFCWEKL